MKTFKVIGKQNNSDLCFVCGVDNPIGLKSHYYVLEEYRVLGVFNGHEFLQSFPGRMHGGIIASLLDETLGRAIQTYDESFWSVTIELNTKYIKPIPLNEDLYIVGYIPNGPRKIYEGVGYICLKDGTILARAEGKFRMLTVSQITGQSDLNDEQWKYVDNDLKLEEVNLPE